MFVDTHTHLTSEYYDDISDVIKRAKENNVHKLVISGVDENNAEFLNLAKKYDEIFLSLGYHPTELDHVNDPELEGLEQLLHNKKVVAIGEIGLDYHYENTNKELQHQYFKKQLELAKKYNLPVVIHSRDATQDTYDILKEHMPLKGIIHCYSSSLEMAREYIKLGFYIGIGGVVTFKNAKQLKEVIENIDLAYITLETDAPFLTPEPYRSKKNESMYIPVIAEKIAELKGITTEEVAKITTSNAESLFDFSKHI